MVPGRRAGHAGIWRHDGLVLGHPAPSDAAQPARIAIEFTLQTKPGKTRVRLVHSRAGSRYVCSMSRVYIQALVSLLWIGWLIYWGLSARNVKPTMGREPFKAELVHRLPILLAAICLAAPRWLPGPLTRRFLPASDLLLLAGTLLLATGLGVSVWARRHLGRNWSSRVVIKEGHALVRSGPYRCVRHPIYSGIILAFLGTAMTIGEWRAFLALGLIALSFVLKSRAEEAWMRRLFPEYEQYQRQTAALIPLVY